MPHCSLCLRGMIPIALPVQAPQPEPAGGCSFIASTPGAGALRPLRDADAPELDGDDGGQEWVSGAGRIIP